MDYEKKYKEALNLARSYYDENTNQFLDTIFPELKESENEKIRKALIEVLHRLPTSAFDGSAEGGYLGATKEQMLAYLEKQKFKNDEEEYLDGIKRDWFERGKKEVLTVPELYGLEKFEAEQNSNIKLLQKSWYTEGYYDREFNREPKWIIKTGEGGPRYEENPKYGQSLIEQRPTEEQLHNLNEAIKSFRMDGFDRIADSLHSLYNCILKTQEQKSAECSVKGRRGRIGNTPEHIRKKAENFLSKMEPPYDADDICSAYETGAMESIKQEWSEDFDKEVENIHKRYPEVSFAKLTRIAYHFSKWANRYKDTEWGEDDETYLQDALWCIEKAEKVAKDEGDMGACWSARRWLKSLRPVSKESLQSWKPSEEQIYSLGTVVKGYNECTVGSVGYNLKELYRQLKELK